MNEGTHLGQGYNQPIKGCSAEERPNKRPLIILILLFFKLRQFTGIFKLEWHLLFTLAATDTGKES
jgi:hypothetical protein